MKGKQNSFFQRVASLKRKELWSRVNPGNVSGGYWFQLEASNRQSVGDLYGDHGELGLGTDFHKETPPWSKTGYLPSYSVNNGIINSSRPRADIVKLLRQSISYHQRREGRCARVGDIDAVPVFPAASPFPLVVHDCFSHGQRKD